MKTAVEIRLLIEQLVISMEYSVERLNIKLFIIKRIIENVDVNSLFMHVGRRIKELSLKSENVFMFLFQSVGSSKYKNIIYLRTNSVQTYLLITTYQSLEREH